MAQHDHLDVLDLHGAVTPNDQLKNEDKGEVGDREEHQAMLPEPGQGLALSSDQSFGTLHRPPSGSGSMAVDPP